MIPATKKDFEKKWDLLNVFLNINSKIKLFAKKKVIVNSNKRVFLLGKKKADNFVDQYALYF